MSLVSGRGFPYHWHSFPWDHSYLADDLSSTPVSSWANGQGGAALSQGTGTDQPAWSSTSGPNSQPGVTFDGSSDYMQTASFAADVTQPLTVVLVFQLTDASGTSGDALTYGLDADHVVLAYKGGSSIGKEWAWQAGAATQHRSGVVADTSTHTMTLYVNSTSTEMELDGTGIYGPAGSAGDTDVLDGLTLAAAHDGTLPAPAVISAVGIYSGDARTDAAWSFLATYVSTKWGLTL